MPRGWDEVPWLMSPLMPTGNPNHIIEDMWLGVTVASQGPAGRVLVSRGSPSDPPPDVSFHLPRAAESRAAPGQSGLHARGEGERVLALESRDGRCMQPRASLRWLPAEQPRA